MAFGGIVSIIVINALQDEEFPRLSVTINEVEAGLPLAQVILVFVKVMLAM